MPFRRLSWRAIIFGFLLESFSCSLFVFSDWIWRHDHDSLNPHSLNTEWLVFPIAVGFLLNLFGFDVGAVVMIGAYFLGMKESESLWAVCYVIAIVSQATFWAWSYDYWKRSIPRSKKRR